MTGENGRFAQHPAVQVFIARVGFYNRVNKRMTLKIKYVFLKKYFQKLTSLYLDL
jgi:hypothetical protein